MKFWIILFSALIVLGCGVFLLIHMNGAGGNTAKVYSDRQLIDTIYLNSVIFPYEFTVRTEHGENTVRVERGKISVTRADCPDQICVRQGPISDGVLPIVCLPHRLVIEIGVAP